MITATQETYMSLNNLMIVRSTMGVTTECTFLALLPTTQTLRGFARRDIRIGPDALQSQIPIGRKAHSAH